MMDPSLENEFFWDQYWEMKLAKLDTLGKSQAILAASRLVRRIHRETGRPVRVLELGCGEGQVIGNLLEGHAQICSSQGVAGVDYNPRSLARCRSDFPGWKFSEGDFSDPAVLAGLGQVDLLLLVNALHEVFSSGFSPELGEVDVPAARQRVEQTLAGAVSLLGPGGWLLIFDGLEPAGDPRERMRIRFLDPQTYEHFKTFVREYQSFRIGYQPAGKLFEVELSRRDFTRYITKCIFLGRTLWQTERLESYQYFTEGDFRAALARLGLEIVDLTTLTVDGDKWRQWVEVLSPPDDFPEEHIMITARRPEV